MKAPQDTYLYHLIFCVFYCHFNLHIFCILWGIVFLFVNSVIIRFTLFFFLSICFYLFLNFYALSVIILPLSKEFPFNKFSLEVFADEFPQFSWKYFYITLILEGTFCWI